jgi:signal transduction histidine kinase
MQSFIAKTLDEIHKVIYQLRPTLLDDLGLVPAVKWYAENYLEPVGITVDLETAGAERRLPMRVETALFRIIQEAITNIVRHARAGCTGISLEFKETSVAVRIEDDGIGFDVDRALKSRNGERGLGLLGMKERAKLLGGVLSIKSRPGVGTEVAVEIPIPKEVSNG